MAAKTDLDELVKVLWRDTQEEVNLPRRLILNGNKRAQTNWLISTNQIPDPSAPAPVTIEEPAVIERAVLDNGALDAINARLTAVEELDRPSLPTDEALAAWARSAERVGLSHVEMNAVAETVTKQCEQVGSDAQQRLGELDSQQAALVQSVAESITQGQEDTALAIQSLQASGAAAIGEIEQEAQATAKSTAVTTASKVATEIASKNFGAGVTVVTQDPSQTDIKSFGTRWFGRPLVEGDGALQTVKTGLIVWRFAGGRWLKSSELVPKTVVGTGPTILDQSPKQYTTMTIAKTGGGGAGGSGEALLVNRAAVGVPVFIGDTSNHGDDQILSGEFELEARALDGALKGKSVSLIAAFNYDPLTGVNFTEYALDGPLDAAVTLDLSMQLSSPRLPAGVTATLSTKSQALMTGLTINPQPGGGGGVTRFAIRGSVEYNREATGRAAGPNDATPQLLWNWV